MPIVSTGNFPTKSRPEPIRSYEASALVEVALKELAKDVNAPVKDLVFVPNATAGVNSVLRSIHWKAGECFSFGKRPIALSQATTYCT